MRLPEVKVETENIVFAGGIDRITPALSIKPGFAIDAMNYEAALAGGYQRIDGYERFDGRAAPSTAPYYYVAFFGLSGSVPAVGTIVSGLTSLAIATVAYGPTLSPALVAANVNIIYYLILTPLTGTLIEGEVIVRITAAGNLPLLFGLNAAITATPVGAVQVGPLFNSAPSIAIEAIALNASADVYRARVCAVPGSGPVRGVHMLRGTTYAFRDNEFGTACQMFKSTANGWQFVPLGFEILFSSGTTALVEGATIVGATSGATAVLTRVVVQTGTLAGSNATGRLIFAAKTGTFQGEVIKVGTTTAGFVPTDATPIAMAPGGRFELVNYNFTGSTDTLRMYGCDGVNRGFECDGTVFVPIVTGMSPDNPSHAHAHKNQLFYSFRGSTQNSGIGQPYKWTAVSGANEIGIGADVTAYASQTGDVLAIFARDKIDQLQGSSVTDFVLKPLSPKYGALQGTVQTLAGTYYFDDSGLRQVTRTQDYGSFNEEPQSLLVQPIVDLMRDKVVASSVYRARSQYRIYASDGSGLIATVKARPSMYGGIVQSIIGITQLQYPVSVTCACSGEDATGKDVVFFGASNGFVYQGDKGSSFDGEEIEHYLRLPFNHSKSPRVRKRYRKAVLEMTSVKWSQIRFSADFSYGSSEVNAPRLETQTVIGAGGYWNSGNWGQFVWDAQIVAAPEFSIEGSGTNVSLLFYGKTDLDLGHALQGALLHFTPRRQVR